MNLFISPLLIIGLLASSSPGAGECVSELSAARVCENCAVKVSTHEVSTHSASARLDRQARKHTEYYLTLVRAQQEAGSEPAGARQYSARSDLTALTEIQAQ